MASMDAVAVSDSHLTIVSVDRIGRCSRSWDTFACIALNHAIADITASLGVPLQVSIGFEFGLDASNISERRTASEAFIAAARSRGLTLGKFHSALGIGTTHVVVCVVGRAKSSFGDAPSGSVHLSAPLGCMKALYLAEMDGRPVESEVRQQLITEVRPDLSEGSWVAMTDVSGHGLAGALLALAYRKRVRIDVAVSAECCVSPSAFKVELPCFSNPVEDFGGLPLVVAPKAAPLALLRETNGPLLALVGDDDEAGLRYVHSRQWLEIGRFWTGQPEVNIQ